jgi:hypothetical protein
MYKKGIQKFRRDFTIWDISPPIIVGSAQKVSFLPKVLSFLGEHGKILRT